jgi:hypothetical protein
MNLQITEKRVVYQNGTPYCNRYSMKYTLEGISVEFDCENNQIEFHTLNINTWYEIEFLEAMLSEVKHFLKFGEDCLIKEKQ